MLAGRRCDSANAVMHGNETFAITWDPRRWDWATTRDYVEQYLRDVADGSGTFTSPYAVTSQYSDFGGRSRQPVAAVALRRRVHRLRKSR